ncbi:MAG: hypothetical protein ABIQ30_14110 [Devosia sp.]
MTEINATPEFLPTDPIEDSSAAAAAKRPFLSRLAVTIADMSMVVLTLPRRNIDELDRLSASLASPRVANE